MRIVFVAVFLAAVALGTDVPIGSHATLRATATANATPTPVYEWFKDGQRLSAADPWLILPSVAASDAGSYVVRAANSGGSAISAPLVVVVVSPPEIMKKLPLTASVKKKGDITLSVVVNGTGVHYKWNKNGQEIAGATNPSLVIKDANNGDAATYIVTPYNGISATSSSCKLSVTK